MWVRININVWEKGTTKKLSWKQTKKMYVLWQTSIDVWIEICNTPPSHLLTFSNQINRQLLIRAHYGVTAGGLLK